MLTFHGDKAIKRRYLRRVAAHRRAAEITQGLGWTGYRPAAWRMDALGCTVHVSGHLGEVAYEREIGIPAWLARLEGAIHEWLTPAECRAWPGAFLRAVPVGVDLAPLRARYFAWIMETHPPYGGAPPYQDAAAAARAAGDSAAGAAERVAGVAAGDAARTAFWVRLRDWLLRALRAQRRAGPSGPVAA